MNFCFQRPTYSALFLFVAFFLTACGGGSGGTDTTGATAAGTFTSTVSATVSGLSGTTVLQYNTNDTLPISTDGQFTVGSSFTIGKTYNFSISSQPTGQNCTVSPESVTVSNNNAGNSLVVTCTNKMYNIGGTVAGLTVSPSVMLQDNNNINGDSLAVSNGVFTFAKQIAYNSAYSVSVATPPSGGETCTVNNGSGTVPANDVSVSVLCSLQSYTLGFTVSGLTGTSQVALQASNGDSKIVGNGYNSFTNQVALGSPYGISVFTQPAGQNCTVANGTGTMTANGTNVPISCVNTYNVGGTINGLTGTVVLQNNSGDNLSVTASTFTFAKQVPYGGLYNVTVYDQPKGQHCTVASGSGTMDNAAISNVAVTCITLSQMGGAMQGAALSLVPSVDTLINTGTFTYPSGIASDGTNLYVADTGKHTIRKIVIATGAVTTLAGTGWAGAMDGSGTVATFHNPNGITTDGTNLYVADASNNKIRVISPSSGTLSEMTSATAVVSSFTGAVNTEVALGAIDGARTQATFNAPVGITTDGTNLYVGDCLNNKIRKIVIATGVVSSLTGGANSTGVTGAADGTGVAATFNWPYAITTDGTNLYVTDHSNQKIRKIAPTSGTLSSMTSITAMVSSFTGAASTQGAASAVDGVGAPVSFYWPRGIATDGTNLYVSDTYNNKIRKIVIATGVVSSLTGTPNTPMAGGAVDGPGAMSTFWNPYGITTDGTYLYVVDQSNNKIRKIK